MAGRILVVDDEAGLREMLRVLLSRAGYDVVTADGESAAAQTLATNPDFDLVVTDLSMPDGSGMGVLTRARAADDSTQVIMITAYATTAQAVEAMRKGAYDYIQKPFKNDELLAVIDKAIEKRGIVLDNRDLRRRVKEGFRAGDLVGRSASMERVMVMVERVASAPSSVLITGESGTGKEVVARALHLSGNRAGNPFVAVNCGALPESLLESELFGHEKGAFTGATHKKEGLFRAAQDGTLFLDEIGELPLPLQVKLLRVLQERTVRPVGSNEEVPVSARVVAATNKNLRLEVAEGRFREDLFYRLNVINLELPPLRDRPEDVPLLAEHFLRKHGALQNKRLELSPESIRWLASLRYPGNVRELENLVERAVTLTLGSRVGLDDLRFDITHAPELMPIVPPVQLPEDGLDLDAHLATIERQILVAAVARSAGVRKDAAQLLRMSFRSLRYRLAKYDLGEPGDADTGGDSSQD
jgi:two-component system response regulator PilR (NtrC family)